MQSRGKESSSLFAVRFKFGDCEVEVSGTREEVLKTLEELPALAANVQRAFEGLKPNAVAKLTVKTGEVKEETAIKFPRIKRTEKCDEAVLRVLESDWGKWRPRTIKELHEALAANGLDFSIQLLSGTLFGLAKKRLIRRWKTDAGYVYILAEKEASTPKEGAT